MDEIQTGFCRTGNFFAIEYSKKEITPGFLTLGKGIAGSFPFVCFVASQKVSQRIEKEDRGGTYCGNPLDYVISYAVVNHLIKNNIVEQVDKKGNYIQQKLSALKTTFPDLIKEVRGVGLLSAFEFYDHTFTWPFTLACADTGLLVVPTRNNIICLLPDLLVTKEHIDNTMTILE